MNDRWRGGRPAARALSAASEMLTHFNNITPRRERLAEARP